MAFSRYKKIVMNFIEEIKSLLSQEPTHPPVPPTEILLPINQGDRPSPWVQKSPGFQQNGETGEVVEVRTVLRTVRVVSESSGDGYRPALDYDSKEFQLEVVGSLGSQPLCKAAVKRQGELKAWENTQIHNLLVAKDQERFDREFLEWTQARREWADSDVNFVHSLGIEILDGEICVPDPYEGYMRPIKVVSISELRRLFE